MENIFENAKFGDKFRTRDGRMVIYYTRNDFGVTLLTVFGLEHYHNDGVAYHNTPNEDIVSRWNEQINEEGLDIIAEKFADETIEREDLYLYLYSALKLGFKTGFRKAKEL